MDKALRWLVRIDENDGYFFENDGYLSMYAFAQVSLYLKSGMP